MKSKPVNKDDFPAWFSELQKYCIDEYGWNEEDSNIEYWRPYFDSGISSFDAAEEDLCTNCKTNPWVGIGSGNDQ